MSRAGDQCDKIDRRVLAHSVHNEKDEAVGAEQENRGPATLQWRITVLGSGVCRDWSGTACRTVIIYGDRSRLQGPSHYAC